MAQNKKNCQNCAGGCADCTDEKVRLQQRILEREVDEELRQEQLIAFWKKYRFLIIGGIVCIILGTILHEWYSAWQTKVSIAESDRFEKAVVALATGQTEQALTDLAQLGSDGRTGYRYLAQLKQASILLGKDKTKDGLALLKQVMDDADAPAPLRDAATVSYVGNQLSTGNAGELKALLLPITANEKNAFYGQAVELSALLSHITGDKKGATELLDTAIKSEQLSPLARERLSVLKKSL